MKHIKMQHCSVSQNIYSGVYKIVFPNNKIYIGISNNIYRRMLQHNSDFRNDLPIEKAIKKYGKISEFDILEEINPENRSFMRQREKYWIAKYKSNIKEFGYNISNGGDGADAGSKNHQAKLTEQQFQLVYKDLIDNKLTIQEIAQKYNMSIGTMSRLNNGIHYFHSNITYPIRKTKVNTSGIYNCNSKFSQQDINNIYNLLQFSLNISIKDIAKQYNVYASTIQNINNGKTYYNSNFNYPLRKPTVGKRKLSQEQVLQIIFEIKNYPEKSLAKIGKKLNINAKTISAINCGTIYRQKDEKYPIRN